MSVYSSHEQKVDIFKCETLNFDGRRSETYVQVKQISSLGL